MYHETYKNLLISTPSIQSKILFHAWIMVDNHVVKKNSRPIFKNRRTGRSFLGKSSDLIKGETILIQELYNQRTKQKQFELIDIPITATYLFYFPFSEFFTKQGRISRRLPDLSNLFEAPSDALTKAQIISDDTIIHSFDFSRRLPAARARWNRAAL